MADNPVYATERHCCQLETRLEEAEEIIGGLDVFIYQLRDRIAALEAVRSENGKPVPRHRGGTPKERAVLST
jgi:hypothetical protein